MAPRPVGHALVVMVLLLGRARASSRALAPLVVREVFGLIGTLRRLGMTILLVEQNLRQVLGLADRAYLLEGGRIVRAGAGEELLRGDLVVRSYLGIRSRVGG